MKTIDIINLLGAFNRVYEDPTLTNEEKCAIGQEVMNQLPLPHMIASVSASLKAAYRSIKERVDALEKASERSQPQDGAQERQGKPKAPKPLRKAESNA